MTTCFSTFWTFFSCPLWMWIELVHAPKSSAEMKDCCRFLGAWIFPALVNYYYYYITIIIVTEFGLTTSIEKKKVRW